PSTTTARGGGCATWSGWPTGWRRSPASWFRPRACCAGSLLTREHRAPRTVPRRPRKVVLVQHGHDRRGDDWLPGTRCGSSQDRAEGDERLGCVERPRHELRGSAGAVNRGAEKAIAPLGGEPPGSEDRPGERAERQSDRSVSAGSVDSHGPGVLHGLCHWWAGWKRRGRRGSRGRAACVSAATLQPAPSGSDQPPQALHTGPDPILALALLH